MQLTRWIIFLFLLCHHAMANTQGILKQAQDITSGITLLIDSTRSITIEKLIQGEHQSSFEPLSEFSTVIVPHNQYWLKIPFAPNVHVNSWWLLIKTSDSQYTYYPQWDDMHAYVISKGEILQKSRSGINTPRSQKAVPLYAGANVVPVSLNVEDSVTVYIQLDAGMAGPAQGKILVELRDPSIGYPESDFSPLLVGMSVTAFMIGLLSLFFFLFVREKAYFFFFLYVVFLGLHYLILHPTIPFINVFIPENPGIVQMCFMFLAVGSFILILLFGRYFINLRSLSPKTDKWLMIFLAVFATVLLTEILLMILFHRYVLFPTAFLLLVVAVGFIVRIAFFKNKLALFFVAGAAWLFVFSLLGVYDNIIFNGIGINPWPVGQIGQMIIYMAGLAYKIRMSEQAKAKAIRIQELDEIKSKFFANISHEFRTPLTLIRGTVQQIMEKNQGRKNADDTLVASHKQINTLHKHADRLLELVNQLLDLSRLDSGKMHLQIVKGDAIQLLKSLTHSFDSLAERKQIFFQTHFPENTPMIYFDKDKLEKIFTNLLGNAFKYTPEKGSISVSVMLSDDRLRCTIEDSGPGIPKKELDKVFDRFYQVEGNEDKGSGIGLALVKELIDLYRGQVSVNSEPGRGTQFKISLPVNESAFAENEKIDRIWQTDESKSIHKEAGSNGFSTETELGLLPLALIVEDNADLRQFISEALESQYQVVLAKDGNEGLQKSFLEIPDIIISDVMMPGMDGFALCEKLKRDERTSHVPVILLTAKAGQQHKIEGLTTGADDYLTKPFDVKELVARMQNLIDGRKLLRKKFAGTIHLKPAEVSASSLDTLFLQKVMEAIEESMHEESFGVEELARQAAMSRSQLHRKLMALLGKSPSELIKQTRLFRAQELLKKKSTTPAEVAFKVGFSSHSYFTKCFKEEFGVTPSEI